ncbi:MAG: transglycosylase domain-containing protein, partial [Mogibacterium sp.]|nr:transglycosylase domain-containing protein [Mogibacterium sp.]
NTIYLGHGCYGVNSAARTYFSKSVKKLDLIECASLAALPQAPHDYSLLKYASEGGELSEDSKVVQKNPDKVVTNDTSKPRRQLTLDLMLEQGFITKEEHDECYDKALNDFIDPNLKTGSGNYSYFHEYLVDTIIADLMEQKNLSFEEAERMVYTGGLQIFSTVDSKAQNVIAEEFKDGSNFPDVSSWRQDGDGNILNNDGKIALYDYEDYFDKKDNFRLRAEDKDIKFHDDGSATIYANRNLNIYETEVDGATDYSIEFKNYYVLDDGIVYSIQGGYVNIPAEYKSGDGVGNVIVSADFFNDSNYKESFKRKDDDLIITDTGYSIGQMVRQPQGGMVIVQVGTGEVKAMVGGRLFRGQRLLNRAVNPRQPGSPIKPLTVYGAALQKSYELSAEGKKWEYVDYKIDRQGTKGWGDYVTVHSSIEDERTRVNGKYWPLNASRTYTGTNNFRTAIQQSINTCAVKLVYQVTPEYAMKQAKKFGITTAVDVKQNKKVNDVNPAAMALGAMTEGVTPLEMALAYASFPGGGKVNTPICYTKILDRNGNVILEGKSEQTEAMNAGVAWIMTDVLKSVVSRGIAGAADISEVDVGGKTGTTNDNYDIWFDGFTPNYAAALWIGTDNNIEMNATSYTATVLWSKIMEQIPKAKEGKYKKQPENVITKWGEYYTEGTETGLTFWSYAAMKKKARDAAYKRWKAEREKHKKWVETKPAQDIYETKRKYLTDEEAEALRAAGKKPKKQGDQWYIDEQVKTGKKTKPEGKWVYEPGWRDGDFTYKFDGRTYSD